MKEEGGRREREGGGGEVEEKEGGKEEDKERWEQQSLKLQCVHNVECVLNLTSGNATATARADRS